ncbi:MAG: SDR family oxidoreductase [Acidobacteriota bacterium]|nr:SDR family oxidoreductase [Acidobacteriota bacterium]
MILVTGAGGTVGSEVVRQLRSTGAPYRAAHHSQKKAEAARANGEDAVVIDYAQPETVARALEGVRTLFLLSGGAPDQTEREINAVNAAKSAGVERIVKLSVWGAEGEGFSFAKIHRPVEQAIEASGLAWTHLRPNSFMQNMQNYLIGTITSQGAFYSSIGDSKMSHIDVRDIGAVAVKTLTGGGHDSQAYSLSGPAALSYDEVAKILSDATGRTIRYVNVTDDDVKQALMGGGAPEGYANAYVDLLRYYRTGEGGRVTDTVRQILGRDPISFEQYARDNAGVFAD